MTKWLLLVWLQSTVPGVPTTQPAIVVDKADTHDHCIDKGRHRKWRAYGAYRVVDWGCMEGGEVTQGKEGGQK